MLRRVMLGRASLFNYDCPKGRVILQRASLFNYDCPEGQVMSYEILRIVMIGYAKFEVERAIIS